MDGHRPYVVQLPEKQLLSPLSRLPSLLYGVPGHRVSVALINSSKSNKCVTDRARFEDAPQLQAKPDGRELRLVKLTVECG